MNKARPVPNFIVTIVSFVSNLRRGDRGRVIRAHHLFGARDAPSRIEELAPINSHVMLTWNQSIALAFIASKSKNIFETSMSEYWCRFLDSRGRVISSEKVVAANDADAIAKVRAIVLAENRNGFEIWDGSRHVDTEHADERAD